MSFPSSGVSVSCGFVGSVGRGNLPQAIYRIGPWSELPASGTPTTNAAPDNGLFGEPLFHVKAFADAWVAIGPNPNPATGARFPVAAGNEYDFAVTFGDKLAWIAA